MPTMRLSDGQRAFLTIIRDEGGRLSWNRLDAINRERRVRLGRRKTVAHGNTTGACVDRGLIRRYEDRNDRADDFGDRNGFELTRLAEDVLASL